MAAVRKLKPRLGFVCFGFYFFFSPNLKLLDVILMSFNDLVNLKFIHLHQKCNSVKTKPDQSTNNHVRNSPTTFSAF